MKRPMAAALALLLTLLATAAASKGHCPEKCQQECIKTCFNPFDYSCAAQPWQHMQVCGWDGQRYKNECCARCAGTAARAFCSVPLAKATFPNSNPRLCTLYCADSDGVVSIAALGEQVAVVAQAMADSGQA